MSGNVKVRSLSLSRKTQSPRKEESEKPILTEEEIASVSNLEAALSSPIARPSRLCSTPIQKNVETMEDSPEVDYRGSPTSSYPCTQDSNEIAWDWHCAGNRQSDSSGMDKMNKNNSTTLNITPKRRQPHLSKKRGVKSYSPLLNIPTKRKLVNVNRAESIGKFAAELKALTEIIKTEQNGETSEKTNAEENTGELPSTDSRQSKIFDMETQNVFDIHDANTLEVSYVAEEKKDTDKQDSSLDDLFDDDIDACMVQCSQEIENKLKLDSEATRNKPVLNLSNEDDGGVQKAGCGASKNSSNPKTGTKSCTVNIETRYEAKIQKETPSPDSKWKEKSNTKIPRSCTGLLPENDIPQSQIPDDSMDDCLALCLDDDTDLFSKYLEDKEPNDSFNLKKFNGRDSGRDEFGGKEAIGNPSSSSNVTKPNSGIIPRPNNQALDVSSNFKRKQECMGSDNAAANLESRKYFKTKSLSDSYFGNSAVGKNGKFNLNQDSNLGRSYPPPMTKSNSNFNLSMKNKANETQNKVSSTPDLNNCVPAAGSRDNFADKVSYSYLRSSVNLNRNLPKNGNCDPYAKRVEAVAPLKDQRTTMPTSSQRYNAEEIERKRLEAKMRLEANKLKKQTNSVQSKVGIISLQNKRPVVKR